MVLVALWNSPAASEASITDSSSQFIIFSTTYPPPSSPTRFRTPNLSGPEPEVPGSCQHRRRAGHLQGHAAASMGEGFRRRRRLRRRRRRSVSDAFAAEIRSGVGNVSSGWRNELLGDGDSVGNDDGNAGGNDGAGGGFKDAAEDGGRGGGAGFEKDGWLVSTTQT